MPLGTFGAMETFCEESLPLGISTFYFYVKDTSKFWYIGVENNGAHRKFTNHKSFISTHKTYFFVLCLCCPKSIPKNTNQIRYSVASFDENDGLLSSIFNQNAIFKNKEGNIYLGCTKGYTVFNPKNIRFNHLVPQPRFTELLISNDVISPDVKYKNRIRNIRS